MDPTMSQDPATQAGATPQPSGPQPVAVIEVTVMDDGTITVENEASSEESGEEAGESGSAESGEQESGGATPVTVKSAQEAGELVSHLVSKAQGGAVASAPGQNVSEQAQGYSGG